MKHPNSRADRLRIKEQKNEKKKRDSEERAERLRRKELLSKEIEDEFQDDYVRHIKRKHPLSARTVTESIEGPL